MQSQEQKLSLLLQAINDYAEKQRLRILTEMDEQSQTELSRAEKEALSDAYRLIQHETADVRASIAKDLSARDLEGRRKLFEQRNEIERKVFAEAAKRLADFTKTEQYRDYLDKAVAKAKSAFASDAAATLFRVRESDMKYAEHIKSVYGAECAVEPDNDIRLGGILAMNSSLGIAIDATLDARLEAQRPGFQTFSIDE